MQRIGREIARLLNRAIAYAERQGHIVSDNPLNAPGLKPHTFRLPSQPEVVPRELGPRSLDLVPAAELAYHLEDLSLDDDLQSEEELFREVLDRLGLIRLTEKGRSVLAAATALMSKPGREAAAEWDCSQPSQFAGSPSDEPPAGASLGSNARILMGSRRSAYGVIRPVSRTVRR